MSVFADFLAPATACPLGTSLAEHPAVSVEVERLVPTGRSTHHVWVRGEGHEAFVAALRSDDSAGEVTVVDEFPNQVLVRVDRERLASPLFALVEETEATLVGVHGTAEGWTVSVRFPDVDALGAFREASQERGVALELRETYESNGGSGDSAYGLTPTQAETLVLAFEAGYFEVPRRRTLADLAERIDVSEQAVSERLRRGLSTLLTSQVFEEPPEESTDEGTGP